MAPNDNNPNTILSGVASSSGIALGRAFHVDRNVIQVPHHRLAPGTTEHELERLESAFVLSRHQLHEARIKLTGGDHLQILDTHIAFLEDPQLERNIRAQVTAKMINAEWAVNEVINEVASVFDRSEDSYLRERRRDFEQISQRLLANLMGLHQDGIEHINEPVILVAHDLSPADMAHINREFILGILTDIGGQTSHTSILARAMEIPAVVGLESITREVKTGDLLILDGFAGRVMLNPSLELIDEYDTRRRYHLQVETELRLTRDLPTVTADGATIQLSANIELPSEIVALRTNGLNRVGLFRSEFIFLIGTQTPDEEAQYHAYREVVEGLGPNGVTTIRTLDLGGDKLHHEASALHETNPAMGLRAIRLCLARRDLFRTQLRAILRTSAHGKVRIMFPMISGIEELREAKAELESMRRNLREENIPFDETCEVGIMIEVPSAALIADLLAREVNFFSIGTNDLIQYMLAIDRSNEHVNYLFTPAHPAILRAICSIIDAGHHAGISVAMCGEMAGDPDYVMFLVGLGIDELSMTPHNSLRIKRLLSRFTMEEARQVAQHALTLQTSSEVSDYVITYVRTHYPEEFWVPDWCEDGPCLTRDPEREPMI